MRVKTKTLLTLCVGMMAGTGRFAFGNAVGPDMQNFNATPDGLDFVTVQSSETLRQGFWNFGLFTNYAKGTLPRFPADGSNRPAGDYNDTLTGLDVNVSYGATNRLTLGVSVPQIIGQSVTDANGEVRGEFLKPGTTEIRPMMKFQLGGGSRGGVAAILSAGINMIEGNPYTGLGAPPILNFELAADRSFGDFAAAVNVGYRHRTPGTALTGAPVEPLGSQWLGSVAGSYLVSAIKSRLILEGFGSVPVKNVSNRSDRMLTSAEVIAGIKHMATDALALHAGAGRELTHGIASPDFRLYAGLNYSTGPGLEKQQKTAILRRPFKHKDKPQVQDYVPRDSDDLLVTDTVGEDPTPPLGEETFIVSNVMFAFDRDNLITPGGKDILKRLAVYLMRAPEFKRLTIEGHTDFIGGFSYNQELSLRRASQIRRHLVENLKIDAARVDIIGFGEMRPIADNGNFQGRRLNRRVEFKILR